MYLVSWYHPDSRVRNQKHYLVWLEKPHKKTKPEQNPVPIPFAPFTPLNNSMAFESVDECQVSSDNATCLCLCDYYIWMNNWLVVRG